MSKIKLGFLVLGLITAGLTVYVVSLGVGARSDAKTERKANEIATKLNSYVQGKGTVPESLTAADIKDVPSTISYTKKTSDSYEFCVTYKNAKTFGGSLVSTLSTTAISRATGMPGSVSSGGLYTPSDGPTLYIGTTHTKGKNCQTVTNYYTNMPSIPDDYMPSPSGSSSSSAPSSSTMESSYCDPSGEYYTYVKDYCSGTTTSHTDLMTQ